MAYRNAAKAIRDSGVSVEEMARAGRAEELAGVGKTIEEKIDALLESGAIPSAEKLKAKYPAGLVEVTRIPGLGPKRARLLHDHLGVKSLDDLRAAAEADQLRDVPGFGKKAEENVLDALAEGFDGNEKQRVLLKPALDGRRRPGHDAARPPGLDPGRDGGQRAPLGRDLQGPRHRRLGEGPARRSRRRSRRCR